MPTLLIALLAAAPVLAPAPVNVGVDLEQAPAFPPEVAVPFGCGLSFPVSQAHATGSHLDNDSWAWDFRMPEGVPIVAARRGVVRLARGDSTRGGCDPAFAPDANYVVISHGNGLETQYLHFVSVMVKPGDEVEAGEVIGFSGRTGWACGSHLHFKVARTVSEGWNNPSVPATIRGYGDPQTTMLIVAPGCAASKPLMQQARAPAKQNGSVVGTGASSPPKHAVPSSAVR